MAIVIDLFSVCVAFTLASSRVLLALARDGLLPRALARSSRRFGTPVGGLVVVAAWALIVIGWSADARYGSAAAPVPAVLESVLILSGAGSFLVTVVYLPLAAGGLRLLTGARARPGGPEPARRARRRWRAGWWWRLPVLAAALAVPVLSLDGALNPFPGYPGDLAVFFAAAAAGISLAWYATLRALGRAGKAGDR